MQTGLRSIIYDRPGDLKKRDRPNRNRPGRRNGSENKKTEQKRADKGEVLDLAPELGLRKCNGCHVTKPADSFPVPATTSCKSLVLRSVERSSSDSRCLFPVCRARKPCIRIITFVTAMPRPNGRMTFGGRVWQKAGDPMIKVGGGLCANSNQWTANLL